MKLVFRDVQSHRDLIYEATSYHLEVGEILQELQQKHPYLQNRFLQISYAGHPLESFWTLDYLTNHFQIKEFDTLQLHQEKILSLADIQTLDDLLDIKDDHLRLALQEIPFDSIQENFGDLSIPIQAKILKNISPPQRELLEKTGPSRNTGNTFSLLQAFIYQGEQLSSREKEEKATQKLKKLLRKKDVFFSSVTNNEETSEEDSTASSIDETLSKLSSEIFETQKEIQHQENLEQHLFTQIKKNTPSQKEFLESLLQEEPSESVKSKETIPSEPRNLNKNIEPRVVDQLFEDKNLQETLPQLPVESTEEIKTLPPLKNMDHLFEDTVFPANTPTGHHLEEFFQEKAPETKETPIAKPIEKKVEPLPLSKALAPSVPTEKEKNNQLLESKEYILSKQQLLAAGHALHRPPPLRKQKLIASPEDSDATLPAQIVPRVAYLPVKEKKEPNPPENPISSAKYHLVLDLSYPKNWPSFHPFSIHSDMDVRCLEGIHSYEIFGEMELEIPGTYIADPLISFQAEEKHHTFSLIEQTPKKIAGKLKVRWNQKIIGEFPIEIDFLPSSRKIPYWTLPLAGIIGSLGTFWLSYGVILLFIVIWLYLFFISDQNASRKDPYQTFHFDLYASV